LGITIIVTSKFSCVNFYQQITPTFNPAKSKLLKLANLMFVFYQELPQLLFTAN